jgi:hypothetical protein
MAKFSGGLSSLLGDTNQAELQNQKEPSSKKKNYERPLKLVQRESRLLFIVNEDY